MRFFVTALALFALLAPQAAQAKGERAAPLAQRPSLTHGIAGDERYVFITEPGIGVAAAGPRVVVLDRFSGREVAALPPPDGGFKLPFTLRVPRTGHLVVLDSGGFPPVGPPVVYDYTLRQRQARLPSQADAQSGLRGQADGLRRGRRGAAQRRVRRLGVGLRRAVADRPRREDPPRDGARRRRRRRCANSARASSSGTGMVGDVPFEAAGGFAPGAGSLAVRGKDLYFSSTCEGGVQRVAIRALLDTTRRPRTGRSRSSPSRRARRQAAGEPQGHHVQPLGPE